MRDQTFSALRAKLMPKLGISSHSHGTRSERKSGFKAYARKEGVERFYLRELWRHAHSLAGPCRQ